MQKGILVKTQEGPTVSFADTDTTTAAPEKGHEENTKKEKKREGKQSRIGIIGEGEERTQLETRLVLMEG